MGTLKYLWTHLFFCLALLLVLTGCSRVHHDIPKAPTNIAPIAPIAKELPPYQIQVGDVLEIRMILNPELNESVIVRPDGMISTTLAQDIPAYGRTPSEIQESLIEAYKKNLSDPNLSVIVRTFAPTRVYVLGEVRNPGEFVSVGPNLTMLQAISRAGGVLDTADLESIIILRRGAADEPVAYSADFEAAAFGGDASSDVRLAAFDVVFVPRMGIAEAGLIYEQYIERFLPPTIGFGYNLNNN